MVLYRALLRLLPPAFQRAYAREMTDLLSQRLARTQGSFPRTSSVLARTYWDLAVTLFLEWRDVALHTASRIGRFGLGDRMHTLLQDLRQAARRLVRTPAFTILGILILAFGIGANAAIFTVVDTFLLRPLAYPDPEALVDIYQDSDDGEPSSSSFPAYRDMAAQTDVFVATTAIMPWMANRQTESGGHPVLIEYATSTYPEVLGLRPFAGRWIQTEEDTPGGPAVAVLSHATWSNEFGSDAAILGTTLRLNGTPVTVVGVGPAGFGGVSPGVGVDLWLSFSALPDVSRMWANSLERREDHPVMVKARLADGVSLARARSAMSDLAARLAEEFPEINRGRDISVFALGSVRIHPQVDGLVFPIGAVLMTVVGLVLVIACSNLANLLLVRGSTRGKEVALRLALGSSRGRLVRHLLTESVLLATAGGVAGLVLAHGALRALESIRLPFPIPIPLDLSVDSRVIVFGLGLSLLTGVVFGVAPAIRATRPDLVRGLKDDTSGVEGRVRRFGLKQALVSAQVAVSMVLLLTAGLFVRSLLNTQRVDPGFRTDGIAVLSTDPTQAGYEGEDVVTFYRDYVARIEALRGVERVATANVLPLTQTRGSSTLFIEGYEPPSGTGLVEVDRAYVSQGYFDLLEIPLLSGRGFEVTDLPESPRVAVISTAMAERYYGRADAVGERFRFQAAEDSWVTVVGVVGDAKVESLSERPTPIFYMAMGQTLPAQRYVMARGEGNPSDLVGALRTEVRGMDPQLPVLTAQTLEAHLGDALFLPRMAAALLVVMGLLALGISTLGIYAVVAFVVSRRAPEVGIRLAIGASGHEVVRQIMGESLAFVVVGVVAGLAISLVASPALNTVLIGLPAFDVLNAAAVAALFCAMAGLAAYVPARRAATADPVSALRAD